MDSFPVIIFKPLTVFLVLSTASVMVLLFVILLLLLLSFLVAGSEVAFFSLTSRDINALKTRQQPAYERIVSLLEEPKVLLASLLIANSLLNIAIILISNILINNWLPTDAAGDYIWPTWAVFALKALIVIFVIVLFAEVTPKIWATYKKVRFAAAASLIVEIFNWLFRGLARRLVQFSDNVERRLNPETNVRINETNLDYAIDLLPEHEATTEEKQILKGIHKFSNTSVKQIMRTRLDVSGISFDSMFTDVKNSIEELHYSRIPVYRNNLDEIAGILHTKDLLPHLNEDAGFEWQSLLRKPFFVHEQKFIEDLLQEFRSRRVHFAVVVDEFGGTSGIVTLEDIMEEIIGDINDEFDDEESANKKLDENNYIFEGRMMINDACKVMKLPAGTFDAVRGDSDSIAGLVLEIAGEFPKENEQVVSGDFTFIPLSINKNRIDNVQVIIQRNNSEQ